MRMGLGRVSTMRLGWSKSQVLTVSSGFDPWVFQLGVGLVHAAPLCG